MSRVALLFVLVASLSLPGCLSDEDRVQLTGVSAFKVIRRDRKAAPSTDIAAVSRLLDEAVVRETDRDAPEDVEPGRPVSSVMRKTTKAKVRLDPHKFVRPPESYFLEAESQEAGEKGKEDGVDLAGLADEFMIPRVEDIPVRNQGSRGTCAAFAGIGHLEYAALQRYGLRTIDFSEQRFYYLSRPDCHSTGCVTDIEAGSWYGDGYEQSQALPLADNIPLEADCPYNPNPGRNEVQIPQLPSCERGAVKVEAVAYVTYPQEVVDALHRYKLPILWASPLSDNWFENRGLITARDAGDAGASMHAGGHAYLIVGYRKLPDLPEEGGMCFIVKNSWGTGWGVHGYSCQTLEWMREWRFWDGGRQVWLQHPLITGLTLRDDLQTGELPDNDEAEDESPPDIPDEELDDEDEGGDDDVPPVPDPTPEPDVVWDDIDLYGPNDSYYRAQYSSGASGIMVRVALKGDVPYSNGMALSFASGSKTVLEYDGDPVGEIRDGVSSAPGGKDLLLCSHKYALICSLRLDPNTNRLYIEFPYPSTRRVKDEEIPPGEWVVLAPEGILGDYEIQLHTPDDPSMWVETGRGYVRLKRSGQYTENLRITSDEQLGIKVMGLEVGNLVDLELCTGSYEDTCRFLKDGAQLFLLPGW